MLVFLLVGKGFLTDPLSEQPVASVTCVLSRTMGTPEHRHKGRRVTGASCLLRRQCYLYVSVSVCVEIEQCVPNHVFCFQTRVVGNLFKYDFRSRVQRGTVFCHTKFFASASVGRCSFPGRRRENQAVCAASSGPLCNSTSPNGTRAAAQIPRESTCCFLLLLMSPVARALWSGFEERGCQSIHTVVSYKKARC